MWPRIRVFQLAGTKMSDYFASPDTKAFCIVPDCGQSGLDDRLVECAVEEVHRLNDLSDGVKETFNKMIRQFCINESELSEFGLTQKTAYDIDTVRLMARDEYVKAVTTDSIYGQFLNTLFDSEISERLVEIDKEEQRHDAAVKDELKKFRAENHKFTKEDISRRAAELERNSKYARFKNLIDNELHEETVNIVQQLRNKSSEVSTVDRESVHFRNFMRKFSETILRSIFETRSYRKYLDELIGVIDMRGFTELFEDYMLEQFNKGESLGVQMFIYFLKWDVILRTTSVDQGRRKLFLDQVANYKDRSSGEYVDYQNHLLHFIQTMILKRDSCMTYIQPIPSMRTNYMQAVLRGITKSYNHTLNVSLGEVVLEYLFREPFSSRAGFRSTNPVYGDRREIYDFLELYNRSEPVGNMRAIVYKQGTDIRVKKRSPSIEIESLIPVKKNASVDEETLATDKKNYTLIYFDGLGSEEQQASTNNPSASFDHYSNECRLVGTSDQIRGMLEILNRTHGLQLKKGELVSYEGHMLVTTRVVMMKSLFNEIFQMEPIARYFYPRSDSMVAPNYFFRHTPEYLPVPSRINDYVAFKTSSKYKVTTTSNVWEVPFDGNSQAQVLPFLSMFISLMQMMENFMYDKRFEVYQDKEREYLDFLRGVVRTQENAISFVTKNHLSKRDLYVSSLRETGLSQKQLATYHDQTRPFAVRITTENLNWWRVFYASVIAHINPILNTMVGRIVLPDSDSDSEPKRVYDTAYDYIEGGDLGITGITYGEHTIGMPYKDFIFFAYPMKGQVYPLEIGKSTSLLSLEPVPIRAGYFITGTKKSDSKAQYSSQRNHEASPEIIETIRLFTTEMAQQVTTFVPQKDDGKSFIEIVNTLYDPSVIRALLSQHLWDHTPEEIQRTLLRMNVFLHQDMIQNMIGALILCFDASPEGYVYTLPRHNQWYAVDSSYDRAVFLFRKDKKNDNYQVALFNTSMYASMDDRMKAFIYTGLLKEKHRTQVTPISYKSLSPLLNNNLTLAGQLFDANGKCVGIRVQSSKTIRVIRGKRRVDEVATMDLRIAPQCPIMVPHEDGSRKRIAEKLGYVSDMRTNVERKFDKFDSETPPDRTNPKDIERYNMASRFTLIRRYQPNGPDHETDLVEFPISSIYESSRQWKQRNYIFCRMVITHWYLARKYMISKGRQATIRQYLETFIVASDPTRAMQPQSIESVVVPEIHVEYETFVPYLHRVYPNVFYGNKFHVGERELRNVLFYMERELDIIRTCPDSFMNDFINSRMDTKLLPNQNESYPELMGQKHIVDDIRLSLIKTQQLSNTYFMKVVNFEAFMDPLYVSKKLDNTQKASSKKKDERKQDQKAPLIMIEYEKKFYLLRLTKLGYSEIAAYICDRWKKERRIMEYEETRTLVSATRNYELNRHIIKERDDNDNEAIEATGQNYQILEYGRNEIIREAEQPEETTTKSRKKSSKPKISPRQVFAAMLPLD